MAVTGRVWALLFILKAPAFAESFDEFEDDEFDPVTACAAAPAIAPRPAPIAWPILTAEEKPFRAMLFSKDWK